MSEREKYSAVALESNLNVNELKAKALTSQTFRFSTQLDSKQFVYVRSSSV